MIPAEMYMTANAQRKIAQLFNTTRLGGNHELLQSRSKDALVEKLSPVQWHFIDHEGEAERLIEFIYSIREEIASDFAVKSSSRKKKAGSNSQVVSRLN